MMPDGSAGDASHEIRPPHHRHPLRVGPAGTVPGRAEDVRLAELVKAQGVSGFERDVRDGIASMLPFWAKPKVDEAGNLVVMLVHEFPGR